MRHLLTFILFLIVISAKAITFKHDLITKSILITNESGNLQLQIDYRCGCKISQLNIRNNNVISSTGTFTSFKMETTRFTSLDSKTQAIVNIDENILRISNIVFGDETMSVKESWIFSSTDDKITWEIDRHYMQNGKLDKMSIPDWNFTGLSTWKAGILNTGGVVWCKYLEKVGDTYGVHTDGVTFWNPDSGDGFRVKASSDTEANIACSFSHSENDIFNFSVYLSEMELEQRYNLSRFVHNKTDVFAPIEVKEGSVKILYELSYVDYPKEYDRGTLVGIDVKAVRELLNTTGRYGVVDKNIIGANGWLTNWKCLHEPFFAQIGMAVDDENYTNNLSSTLDRERDNAIEENGRVLSRWHDVPEAQNSNYDYKTGYYDCPWGYTIDAQPGEVINISEQFDQNGDINWLLSHKQSCEKVLNWLINRDSNKNGIFEMLNDSTGQNKCSDWIDVVWASFENSFVNAQMYEALNLWAECESVLDDHEKAAYYSSVAARLKEIFNKPVQEGGFWLPARKQYIYWRDKNGSLHGDNMVTPVNFAAIAFGICDDPDRIKEILDEIENRTKAENLFHWPLCFESFKLEEVHPNVNWPFPNYENGDIFLTWGYLGIRSYVKYDKNIALKYIKNILHQYNKDGLSSQRYSRKTQKGIGSDILAGNCTSITALYRDIYGIRPKWNRIGLEPNMLKELNGTEFSYTLRNKAYNIKLNENNYLITTEKFSVRSDQCFGVDMQGDTLLYYPGNLNEASLGITRLSLIPIKIEISNWDNNRPGWTINSEGKYNFTLTGLKPNSSYILIVDGVKKQSFITGKESIIRFTYQCKVSSTFRLDTNI